MSHVVPCSMFHSYISQWFYTGIEILSLVFFDTFDEDQTRFNSANVFLALLIRLDISADDPHDLLHQEGVIIHIPGALLSQLQYVTLKWLLFLETFLIYPYTVVTSDCAKNMKCYISVPTQQKNKQKKKNVEKDKYVLSFFFHFLCYKIFFLLFWQECVNKWYFLWAHWVGRIKILNYLRKKKVVLSG